MPARRFLVGINVSSQVVAARIANIDAERLRRRAQERGEGVSPYLAELIRRDLRRASEVPQAPRLQQS
jgi:hypothetical protein